MNNTLHKLFAAYRSELVSASAVETCYPIVEHAISVNDVSEFSDVEAKRILDDQFGEIFPLAVVRQVLDVGVRRKALKRRAKQYAFVQSNKEDDKNKIEEFENRLDQIAELYVQFCRKNNFPCEDRDFARETLINSLNVIDAEILAHTHPADALTEGRIEFSLYKFINHCATHCPDDFSFLYKVCLTNLKVESLLYAPESTHDLKNLTIYLDTPVVYALLGLSDDASIDIYKKMLEGLRELGCQIRILDRNWSEIESSLRSTIEWAYGPKYHLASASPSARVMRKKWKGKAECEGALLQSQRRLESMGVIVRPTEYLRSEDRYQIDEAALGAKISSLYHIVGKKHCVQLEKMIEVDVVALSMIYRLRHGNLSYKIEYSNHLMVTSNATLAKASRQFDRQLRRANRQGPAIPACVHADLIATLLWVSQPSYMEDYQRNRMLALCYEGEMPSQKVLSDFAKHLEMDAKNGSVDRDTYQFLRRSSIVEDALMRVTNGREDYIDDEIVSRVMDCIKNTEREKFDAERARIDMQIRQVKAEASAIQRRNEGLCEKNKSLESRFVNESEKIVQKTETLASWFVACGFAAMFIIATLVLGVVFRRWIVTIGVGIMLFLFELYRMGSADSIIGRIRYRVLVSLINWIRR